MDADVEKKLTEISKDILDLKLNVAASKPVGDIAKYLIYFWFSISIFLGFLGWKELTDLDDKINNEVNAAISSKFAKDETQYMEYEKLIENTKNLYEEFENLTEEYKQRVGDLEHDIIAKPHFDIAGKIDALIDETQQPDVTDDEKWRMNAIVTLQNLKNAMTEENFTAPADFVFNAAQLARTLKQFRLAEDMTQIAFKKDPSSPNRALKLSSQIANSIGTEREKALSELFGMVRDLDIENSPHIVLSEAWNASERTRGYEPLLSAIEDLIGNNKKRHIPSYVYAIKANIFLRRSWSGDIEHARQALESGYMIFQSESPLSQWNDGFMQEYLHLAHVLRKADDRNQKMQNAEGIAE